MVPYTNQVVGVSRMGIHRDRMRIARTPRCDDADAPVDDVVRKSENLNVLMSTEVS